MSQPVTTRIALFGPYASRNLGDTATQLAVIRQLRARLPNVHLLGVCPEPEDTLQSLGIAAFPLSGLGPTAGDTGLAHDIERAARPDADTRRMPWARIRRMSRFVRTLDMLIISGGGQLEDYWGGPGKQPWLILLWTALARRHGVKVSFLGVGLDQLNAKLSQHLIVAALQLAHQRAFRDPYTQAALQNMGLTKPSIVCPDLAFSLSFDTTETERPPPFVVLSPIAMSTWSWNETETHERYLNGLVATGAALAQRGFALRIVCAQPTMDRADAQTLYERLTQAGVNRVTLCDTPRVEDFVRHVQGAHLVIASRLHAVILSLITVCPVVALSHLTKVEHVMTDMGLADYGYALQAFDANTLIERALYATQAVDTLRKHIRARVTERRTKLDHVFNTLTQLLR